MLPFLAAIPGKGKMVMYLVIALVIAAAVAYHFWTVNSLNAELVGTKADLVQSQANEKTLTTAVDTLKQNQELIENQRKLDQAKIDQLGREYRASRSQVGDLRKKLSRHDLSNLMLRKPGLVENRMNKATQALGAEFEKLTDPDLVTELIMELPEETVNE